MLLSKFSALLLLTVPCLAELPGVVSKLNLPYAGTTDPHQMLDLYLPAKRPDNKPLPLVIFIHGGAWREGNKRDGAGIVSQLAATGNYAGACIAYRFSQEKPWPAQIHDCKAAVRFLRSNAKEFGLDPDHFAVSGMSAGGHLALLIGLDGDSRTLEGEEGGAPKESSKVSCVLNWFGPVDFLTMDWPARLRKTPNDNPLDELLGKPAAENPDLARAASPFSYITAGDPPVFTAHGTADPLVPYKQALKLDEGLKSAKVPGYLTTMEGAGHGFQSQALNLRVLTFLNRYLRGVPGEIATTPLRND